jgi:hypothetical protein
MTSTDSTTEGAVEVHPATRRVLRIARNAIFGDDARVIALTRSERGATNIRLRPAAAVLAGQGNLEERSHLVYNRIADEVSKNMPFSECTVRKNKLDGQTDVDVHLPGMNEFWVKAKKMASQQTLPRVISSAGWACVILAFLCTLIQVPQHVTS